VPPVPSVRGPRRSPRLALAWASVRDSLWFVPSIAVAVGTALAILAVNIPTPRAESRLAWVWLFGGSAEGARGVLSTIAGSLITVTGVVFSVTIVALQLASSQFTPRVMRSFVADRTNQVVLGVFIGTFTYTLLILRTVHSTSGGAEAFVPQVGVTFALVLLLVSIGALIVFINHAARSVQASVILHRETQHTLRRIEGLFPTGVAQPASADGAPPPCPPEMLAVVAAREAGYLQAVQADTLVEVAEGCRVTIRMELHVGAFAIPGKVLASVWPAHLLDERAERIVREAFVLGLERTPEQDVEFGIIEISDIAVRALSPGINDPTTAMLCIDRLTQVLAALSARCPPDLVRTGGDGSVRLIARGTTFERAAGLAFDQIRHYGGSNPAIAKKLLNAVLDLAGEATPRDQVVLTSHAEAVVRVARRAVEDPAALAEVEQLAGQALDRTGAASQRAIRAAATGGNDA
jgi:uncharacterized membrane protein